MESFGECVYIYDISRVFRDTMVLKVLSFRVARFASRFRSARVSSRVKSFFPSRYHFFSRHTDLARTTSASFGDMPNPRLSSMCTSVA